jgi:ferritin-like metal-binding protein YciE
MRAAFRKGHRKGRDEVLTGLKSLAKLNGSGAAVMSVTGADGVRKAALDGGFSAVTKAAEHAPKGGITVLKSMATQLGDERALPELRRHLQDLGYGDTDIDDSIKSVRTELMTYCGG